ncbi:MAG: Membrane protein-like protein, partial [Candidatus Gottesmanbacteria bacterium GW2011_GWC2_42_8]
ACLFLLFFFLLANFPFMISFRPFVSGIGVLCAPAFLLEKKIGPFLFETGKCQKSPLWMMALLWGFFYYSVLGYLIFVISHKFKRFIREESDKTRIKKGTKLGIFVLYFKIRLSRLFPFLDLLSPIDVFVLIMIFVSTLLLIFPEFFYIKDIYPAHYRANTMFKLGYQAFMMLGLSSAFIIFRLREYAAKYVLDFTYSIYNTLFIFLFTLIAIYPYFAVSSYYGRLQQYKGQDGTVWMHEQFADDYRAIIWLRKNISNQPVIAEAVGESYTDYARVSAYSGLPTIVGWPVHEWLWRGSYDEAGKRIPEVETLYQTLDLDAARKIIDKYQVEYIFVGSLEREKYPQLEADKFNLLGQVVFVSGSTKIYKISPQAGG